MSSKITLATLVTTSGSELMSPTTDQNVIKSLNICFSHVFRCFCRSQWTSRVVVNQFDKYKNTYYFRAASHMREIVNMWPQRLQILTKQCTQLPKPISRCETCKHTVFGLSIKVLNPAPKLEVKNLNFRVGVLVGERIRWRHPIGPEFPGSQVVYTKPLHHDTNILRTSTNSLHRISNKSQPNC